MSLCFDSNYKTFRFTLLSVLLRNMFGVNTLRRIRWAGHGARMGETRGACRILVAKPEESDCLEELGVDGSIIRKFIFKK